MAGCSVQGMVSVQYVEAGRKKGYFERGWQAMLVLVLASELVPELVLAYD